MCHKPPKKICKSCCEEFEGENDICEACLLEEYRRKRAQDFWS